MSATTIFNETIPARFNDSDDRETMLEVGVVFQINITGDENGSWYLDLKDGACAAGQHDDPDCTITMDGGDFVSLYADSSLGMSLFTEGKIDVDNPMLALQLMQIMG